MALHGPPGHSLSRMTEYRPPVIAERLNGRLQRLRV
jgi:hypothetical protein